MNTSALGRVFIALSLILIAVVAPPTTKSAEGSDDANIQNMLRWCKQPDTTSNRAFCVGYVNGVADVMAQVGLQGSGSFRQDYGMCASKPYPSGGAQVQVFINWAEKYPKFWGQPYGAGVVEALQETWPCSETKAAK